METKNIIIAEFNKDRAYFTARIEEYRGDVCKMDRATFLKAVMAEMVSEAGCEMWETEDNGADGEILLELQIETIARKISASNISARLMGDFQEECRERQRDVYRAMR